MPDGSDDVSIQVRCERLGGTHVEAKSRVVNRRIRGEPFTNQQRHNYHEYKKFNLSGPTERVPSRCHANLKEHRNYHYYYCDKWGEFPHHD